MQQAGDFLVRRVRNEICATVEVFHEVFESQWMVDLRLVGCWQTVVDAEFGASPFVEIG